MRKKEKLFCLLIQTNYSCTLDLLNMDYTAVEIMKPAC